MSWEAEVADLRRRETLARRMGGADRVKRQHDAGKLTVRERIDALLEPGSFHEVGGISGKATYQDGTLVDFQPTNFVFGRGRIGEQVVVVAGDDFTVRGGAEDASIPDKLLMAEQMANELRLPIIRLLDGTGGGGSVKALESSQAPHVPGHRWWHWMTANLGTVPVVSLVLGPVAGLGAARAVASHYSIMVKGTSQVFTAGPPLVARLGEQVTKEDLGGSHIQTRNGVVDDEVETELESFQRARRFLSYLPASVNDLPPRGERHDDPQRRDEWLIGAIPRDSRKPYKIRPVLDALVDHGSFLELGRHFGPSAITGLARLHGWSVAVLASDPLFHGGGWSAAAAQKVAKFIDLADTFHLPVVHLVDQPGFLIGRDAEHAATIRHGVRALMAVYQASVPWCSVILRKVYGVSGGAHQNAARLSYRYAWPSGNWGSLPIEGGIEAAYRAELEAAPDPTALLAEITERLNLVRSPFRTAEAFGIEEIIDPRDTRRLLCEFAELTAPLRRAGPTGHTMRP